MAKQKPKFKLIYHQWDDKHSTYEEALEAFDYFNEDYEDSPKIKKYWNPGTITLVPMADKECNMIILTLDPKPEYDAVPFLVPDMEEVLLERFEDEISGPAFSILPNGVLMIIHYDL